MKTPDITPAAITALILAIATNAVLLFGLDLTDQQRGALTGLITAVVLGAFLIHDAIIRQGRAKISAARAGKPTVITTAAPLAPVATSSSGAMTLVGNAGPEPAPKPAAKPRTRNRAKKPAK